MIKKEDLQKGPASAAVAIIKCTTPTEGILVLRRVSNPDDPWSNHFAFPGGRKEAQDGDLLATCIRETKEETGIVLQREQLNCTLPLAAAGRNMRHLLWVQPFYFSIAARPDVVLETSEVRQSYWLEIDKFRDRTNHVEAELVKSQLFPAYRIDDYYLWGFTYKLMLQVTEKNFEESVSALY